MRFFVTTSDWYNPAAAAFAYLFNRYWSPRQEVTMLCYTPPRDPLPENFSIHSLGASDRFGNGIREWMVGRRGRRFGEPYPTPKWTDSMRPFFETLPDPWFVLLQVDYFLHRPVHLSQVEVLERFLERPEVVKIDLNHDRRNHPHRLYCVQDGLRVIVSEQEADYRSSLQAAIWKTDYFLNLLKPGRSPWEFERLGMEEARNDGQLILGLDSDDEGPVAYLNVFGHGMVNWRQLSQLPVQTRNDLEQLGYLGPHWNGWTDPPPGRPDQGGLGGEESD